MDDEQDVQQPPVSSPAAPSAPNELSPHDELWTPGFARIIGRKKSFVYTIRKLSITLGRKSKHHSDVDCSLG